MKKSNFIFIILLWVTAVKITAQQITPSVISSSGGFNNNTSGMLSFTVGEMVAVETYTSPSVILTQGFQQYWDFGTYVLEDPDHPFSFGTYPNLSDGLFNLVTTSEVGEYVEVQIVDLTGKEILHTSFHHERGITTEIIGYHQFLTRDVFTCFECKRKHAQRRPSFR
jgi:hypothetical protein